MRSGELLTVVLATMIAFSAFAGLAFAQIIPPEEGYAYAKFVMDPYYEANVVIEYSNRRDGLLYIELYNPNNVFVNSWYIFSWDDDVVVYSVTPVYGQWTLKYIWGFNGPFYDHAYMYC